MPSPGGDFFALVVGGTLRWWGRHVGATPSGHIAVFDYSTGAPVPRKIHKDLWDSFVFFQAEQEMLDWVELRKEQTVSDAQVAQPSFQLVVAVTGHRPDKLGGYKIPNPTYDLVVDGIARAFDEVKPSYVITGMAIGVDQWAAEICINMKIPFVAAIPFDNQENKWPPHVQARYQWILSQSYAKYVITPGAYESWKMQKRNEWMIDSCHQVIAVWNGTSGGTANCLSYATRVGKPVKYVPVPAPGMLVGHIPANPLPAGAPAPAPQPKTETKPTVAPKRIIDL